MSTRKMIQERTIDYFAKYPSLIKKTLWRTEENINAGAAAMMRGDGSEILDKSGSDHGFTGEKMASLHILCSSSETILLRRLDLKSLFYDWIMTILTEIELILRDPRGAMLKLRSALKILELRICGELLASPFNLGVCSISGWSFGGCVILSNIGYKNKKDFLQPQDSRIEERSWS